MRTTTRWAFLFFLMALPLANAFTSGTNVFFEALTNPTNQDSCANLTNVGSSSGIKCGSELNYSLVAAQNNRTILNYAPGDFNSSGSNISWRMEVKVNSITGTSGNDGLFGSLIKGTNYTNKQLFSYYSPSGNWQIYGNAVGAPGFCTQIPINLGEFFNLTWVNLNNGSSMVLINDSRVVCNPFSWNADTNQIGYPYNFYIGGAPGGAVTMNVVYKNIIIMNGSSLKGFPPVIPPNLTATATDLYDGSSLNFSLSIVRGGVVILNQTTTNGTILVANITNGMANLTFQSTQAGGYFEKTYNNVNISGQAFNGQLYQSVLYLNASQIITGTQITNFGATAPLQYNQSNSSGWAKLFLKAGNYNITGNTTGYVNNTIAITTTAQTEQTSSFVFGTNRLRVDAISIITNAYIQNFTILLFNGSYSKQVNTTTGNASFDLMAGTYQLNFSSNTHANLNTTITVSSASIYPNYTFSVYTSNSVNASIWDEILGIPITFFYGRTVNLEFSSDVFSQNYSTNTSTFYVDLLTPSEYRIRYYSANYVPRFYYFTLENRTNNNVDLFLLSTGNSTNTVITVQDNTGNVLEGATVYLQRYYVTSNSYKTVAMERTNAEGQVVFNVDYNNAFYKFFVIYGAFSTVTNGAKIFQNTITLTLETSTNPFTEVDNIDEVASYITFNSASQTFSLNAINMEGTSLPFELRVSKISSLGEKTTVCSSTDSFAAGVILCQYNTTLNEGSYLAEGLVSLTGYVPEVVITTFTTSVNTLQEQATSTFGRDGLFYSIIVSGFFGLLGAGAGPIGVLVGFVGGFGLSSLIGLMFFGDGNYTAIMVFVSLLIAAGAIAWRISR